MSGRTSYLSTPERHQLSNWLLLLGGALLLVTIATILRTPGANGFEQSIYSAYPLWFWGVLVATFFVGMVLIFREAFAESPSSQYWGAGFILSLYSVAILLLMPLIRGYLVYGRADIFTHIGHVNAIHQTGGGPFQNVYQSLHQVFLAVSYATGVESMALVNAVAAVITLFSIVASYALLSTIFDQRRMLMTLPFVLPLVAGTTHVNPSPYAQSVLLIPFILYLYTRTQQTDMFTFRLPLAVTVIAVVLYHPLMAAFLLVGLLIHYLVITFSSWYGTLDVTAPVSRVSATSVVQLAGVTFIAWYYNFAGMFIRFDRVFRHILNPDEGETELDTYGATITEFSPELIDIARVGAFQFGHRFVFLSIGMMFVAIAVWRYARGERFSTPYLPTLTLGFLIFSAFGVVFLIVDLIGGFGRPLVFAQYFAAFLAGSIILELYNRIDRTTLLFVVTLAVALLLAMSAVGTVYGAPVGGQSTSQVTQQDIASAEWYLDNELQTTPLQEYGTTLHRFEHALISSESNTVQRAGTFPPDRFNYTEHDTLGASYDTDQYLIVTERGKQFYPNTYPGYEDVWRFHPADFELLITDPTVNRVYNNGEIEIYLVEASTDE